MNGASVIKLSGISLFSPANVRIFSSMIASNNITRELEQVKGIRFYSFHLLADFHWNPAFFDDSGCHLRD